MMWKSEIYKVVSSINILLSSVAQYEQAQMCAEGCEGVFLWSLIIMRDMLFSNKESLL